MKTITPLLVVYFALGSSGCGQETEWFINKPTDISKETIANDVWQWYQMDLLEPLAIQRVEWNSKPVLGKKRWGYFIYYKSRLNDSNMVQSVKQAAQQWEKYDGLPAWAEHVPAWWDPEFVLPPDSAVELAGVQRLGFGKVVGNDVFIFCLKKPLDDAILHEPK